MTPIGVVRAPWSEARGAPIQPRYAEGAEGTVEVFPAYREALADLDGFERIWLLYAFDRAAAWAPRVVPFRDTQERGLFATRAPPRPNPIGMSVVRLRRVAGGLLYLAELDVLDGTPVLDIKPYIPAFDAWPNARAGWFAAGRAPLTRADERFE